jgi:hypothetical protein
MIEEKAAAARTANAKPRRTKAGTPLQQEANKHALDSGENVLYFLQGPAAQSASPAQRWGSARKVTLLPENIIAGTASATGEGAGDGSGVVSSEGA